MEPQRVAEEKTPLRRARPFRPVPGDVEIFRHLFAYRLLQRDQLAALTGRDPKRVHRRIGKLLAHSYVKRIEELPHHIYYLGTSAIPILLNRGLIDERDVKRSREHELKDTNFLEHELMISTIHIALELATRTSPIHLVRWRQGKEELTDVITNGRGTRKLIPDAFFVLEDTGHPDPAGRIPQRGFFLEADRSTMTRAGEIRIGEMAEKYAKYRDYVGANLHEKKYGIQSVRVVTITETRERAASLCALVAETLPRNVQKAFRFATLDDLSAALGAVFLHPFDHATGKRYELMPPPRSFTDAASQA